MIEVYQNFFQTYSLLIFAILGLILGSFANVLIWRIPRKQSIIKPASHCPKCLHILRWYENIPILSYLILRGKCSACQTKISLRYPLVELATMLLAVWGAIRWEGNVLIQFYTLLASPILIALIVIDWDILELPDPLVFILGALGVFNVGIANGYSKILPTIVITIVFFIVSFMLWWMWRKEDEESEETNSNGNQNEPSLKDRTIWGGGAFLVGLLFTFGSITGQVRLPDFISLWGMLTGSGVLLTLWGLFVFLKGAEYVGIGDIKLMGALGIPLGPYVMLLSFALSALIGIMTWIILRLWKRSETAQPFPYAPALIIGVWISWFYGEKIVNWYFSFFLA